MPGSEKSQFVFLWKTPKSPTTESWHVEHEIYWPLLHIWGHDIVLLHLAYLQLTFCFFGCCGGQGVEGLDLLLLPQAHAVIRVLAPFCWDKICPRANCRLFCCFTRYLNRKNVETIAQLNLPDARYMCSYPPAYHHPWLPFDSAGIPSKQIGIFAKMHE